MKICNHCRQSLDDECFAKNQSRCRECSKKFYQRQKESDPDFAKKRREKSQIRYYNNLNETREKGAIRAKIRRRKLRDEFLQEYGNCCACCGETEPKFLCLDHINGDGAEHRKKFHSDRGARGGSATQLLEDLKRQGWPKDSYQILCYNCNNAKAQYGQCPHQNFIATKMVF